MILKSNIKKDAKKLKLLKDSVFLQHFKALENELLKVHSKNDQLVKEFKELGQEYDKVGNDLNEYEERIRILREANTRYTEAFEQLEEENKELKNEITRFKSFILDCKGKKPMQ